MVWAWAKSFISWLDCFIYEVLSTRVSCICLLLLLFDLFKLLCRDMIGVTLTVHIRVSFVTDLNLDLADPGV